MNQLGASRVDEKLFGQLVCFSKLNKSATNINNLFHIRFVAPSDVHFILRRYKIYGSRFGL